MTEVRKHRRVTVSGKMTTVRHHTRGGEKMTRREEEEAVAREAEADRSAPHVSTLGGETEPQPQEWWAGDDQPPPGEFWDDEPQYVCGMCGGSGTSRFWHGATCDRCEGSGRDPYAAR